MKSVTVPRLVLLPQQSMLPVVASFEVVEVVYGDALILSKLKSFGIW